MTLFLANQGAFDWMKDEDYLKLMYWAVIGDKLDLDDPVTYMAKIQWLKLHDRQKRYVRLVDKIKAKEYVARKIGEEYVVPNLGVWDSFDEIDFDALPQQFVLKCNHDSGSVVICRDKSTFDKTAAERKITKKLKTDAYKWGREWPYKHVPRKVFAETYLENDSGMSDITDYKFFCFGGVPRYCQVITDRSTDEKIDFYDMDWNHQPFVGLTLNVENSTKEIKKPVHFEKMIELAGILSKGMCFARIDFFEVKGNLYFGEITLYPAAGFGFFRPKEWNTTLGDMIDLSLVKTND